MKRIFTLTIIFLFMNGLIVHSQQVISNMGATLQSTSGSISFTLGEPIIETLSATSGIVTQGFHQTKLTVTAIEDNYGNSMSVKVYPNPTAEILNVSLAFDDMSQIRLVLYDISGRILSAINADKELMELDFSDYIPGTYILKVFKGNRDLGSYKIIKTE